MCIASSFDYSVCLDAQPVAMADESKSIHQPFSMRSSGSVPRGRLGSRARGLERELRASGRHRKTHNKGRRIIIVVLSQKYQGHPDPGGGHKAS